MYAKGMTTGYIEAHMEEWEPDFKTRKKCIMRRLYYKVL